MAILFRSRFVGAMNKSVLVRGLGFLFVFIGISLFGLLLRSLVANNTNNDEEVSSFVSILLDDKEREYGTIELGAISVRCFLKNGIFGI